MGEGDKRKKDTFTESLLRARPFLKPCDSKGTHSASRSWGSLLQLPASALQL